ncbi:MAG: hypothetical protein JWO74_1581 [Solirubrobacterales bacterium]|nr:hypothetical protein [Solirubrobacterales bacterium]
MANIKLPGGRRVTVNTSSKSSGSRKAKTVIVSVKGEPGSKKS